MQYRAENLYHSSSKIMENEQLTSKKYNKMGHKPFKSHPGPYRPVNIIVLELLECWYFIWYKI